MPQTSCVAKAYFLNKQAAYNTADPLSPPMLPHQPAPLLSTPSINLLHPRTTCSPLLCHSKHTALRRAPSMLRHIKPVQQQRNPRRMKTPRGLKMNENAPWLAWPRRGPPRRQTVWRPCARRRLCRKKNSPRPQKATAPAAFGPATVPAWCTTTSETLNAGVRSPAAARNAEGGVRFTGSAPRPLLAGGLGGDCTGWGRAKDTVVPGGAGRLGQTSGPRPSSLRRRVTALNPLRFSSVACPLCAASRSFGGGSKASALARARRVPGCLRLGTARGAAALHPPLSQAWLARRSLAARWTPGWPAAARRTPFSRRAAVPLLRELACLSAQRARARGERPYISRPTPNGLRIR